MFNIYKKEKKETFAIQLLYGHNNIVRTNYNQIIRFEILIDLKLNFFSITTECTNKAENQTTYIILKPIIIHRESHQRYTKHKQQVTKQPQKNTTFKAHFCFIRSTFSGIPTAQTGNNEEPTKQKQKNKTELKMRYHFETNGRETTEINGKIFKTDIDMAIWATLPSVHMNFLLFL